MAWFFRAIETVQGRWECRHGARLFDDHGTVDEALRHLRAMAAEQQRGVQVFVHTRDGQVRAEGEWPTPDTQPSTS
jgi:succinylarginine dihydrolase